MSARSKLTSAYSEPAATRTAARGSRSSTSWSSSRTSSAGRTAVGDVVPAARVGVERRVLEHAGAVLDQLDPAVEGAVVDHLEGDVRVAVVDAFCARGAGDHREHDDAEAIDESRSQQRPAQAD